MKKIIVMLLPMLFVLTACEDVINTGEAKVPDSVYGVYSPQTEAADIGKPYTQEMTEPIEDLSDIESDINEVKIPGSASNVDVSETDKIIENALTNNKVDGNKEAAAAEKGEQVVAVFGSSIPDTVVANIQYNKYNIPKDYILVTSSGANIREKPDTSAKIVGKAQYFEKVNLIAEVVGSYVDNYKSDRWYKVSFIQNNETRYGYILAKLAEPRSFQFEKMISKVMSLKEEIDNNSSAYITNYKNSTGTAPLYKGGTQDKFGGLRNQSAPAYYQASTDSDFRYISDGALVTILGETGNFYRIRTINFEGEYFVPKKYVSFKDAIKTLTKVVVVDRKNQNEGVFEYIDGKWNLISYTYATTGEKAKYKLPTELGFYMAMQKVSRFLYLDDYTKEIAGYAPYGIRFNGGAYIHGVPVAYNMVQGKRVDPGMQEYLSTIGTVPKSHKCVRNYTSHAKFLYEWAEIGKTAVIVIE